MKKEEKRVSLVDSYLTHHVKTEEERQEILEEIRRNTNQLQNEFQTLQQPEYSSSVAIEKARQVIEQHVQGYSQELSQRLNNVERGDVDYLVHPGVNVTKMRMNPTYLDGIWHFVVASDDMELGTGYALDMLQEINKDGMTRPDEVVEMDGTEWNDIRIIEEFDRLLGKTILIRNVGLMSARNLREFEIVLDRNDRSLLIVFIDTIEHLSQIFSRHRRILEAFSAQFTAKSYSEKEMLDYAINYLDERDFALEEGAKGRLYREIRRMPLVTADGQRKKLADRLEVLMDQAENRPIGTRLKTLFAAKTDAQGRTLIRLEDFN